VKVALAQPRKADAFVAAQQAFARLDYQNAYKSALEALRTTPRNLEARRIAAKSAKELARNAECLKLMQPVPVASATTDDVGLVGECGALSAYTPWSLTFLQQSTSNSNNQDAANFWLGKFYYRKGDYSRAESFLAPVTVLPARLEKERAFMLERSRDVLKAQEPTPESDSEPASVSKEQGTSPLPADAPPASSATAPTMGAGSRKSPAASPSTTKQPVPTQSAPAKQSAASRGSLRKNPTAGGYVETTAYGALGVGVKRGSSVYFDPPEEQKAYDDAINKTGATGNATDKVNTRSDNAVEPYADAVVTVQAGFASALGSGGQQSRFGLEVRAGGTGARQKLPFYSLAGESELPQYALRSLNSGWKISVGPFAEIATNRNFSVGGKLGLSIIGPSFTGMLGSVDASGWAKLEFDAFEVRPVGRFSVLTGKDNKQGAWLQSYGIDARVTRWGVFGFGAPEDHPLLRWTSIYPKGSENIVLFTQLEGNFLEFNLAPRLFLGEQFNLLIWYRYVSGSRRSYVSSSLVKLLEADSARGNKPFPPTASYTSASTDYALEAEWLPTKAIAAAGGVLVRKSITQYSEGEAREGSAKSADLLSSGGESWVRFFLEARASF